jgi:ACS family hexuronate transporter-like MFS transporter
MPPTPPPDQPARASSYRWTICALLFFAAVVNYIDRQVIGILKPTLQHEFGWSEIDYGDIIFAFSFAYAIGFAFAGRLMDKVGTRIGFALALTVWSLAAIAHAEAPVFGPAVVTMLALFGLTYMPSVAGFMAARFVLGLGESGSFPASIKTIAEWFPRRERALATGIFNAGTNIGAIAVPLVVPWIAVSFGWYWAFVGTGAVGFLWLAWWLAVYRPVDEHPRVHPTELAYIRSDPPDPVAKIPWLMLLRHRQTWAFMVAKFMTDPIWWLYLYWVPDFLNRNYGLDLLSLGPPIVVIYLIGDAGSIFGGWLSSTLIKRGWSVNRARKTAMLTMALSVVPIVFAQGATHLWVAVGLVALAAASHQGWSANVFTLVSDTFPRHAVGSVVGLGGMAGAIGGMFIAKITGWVLQTTGSYFIVFLIAGSAYLVALGIVHLLAPRLEPVRLEA